MSYPHHKSHYTTNHSQRRRSLESNRRYQTKSPHQINHTHNKPTTMRSQNAYQSSSNTNRSHHHSNRYNNNHTNHTNHTNNYGINQSRSNNRPSLPRSNTHPHSYNNNHHTNNNQYNNHHPNSRRNHHTNNHANNRSYNNSSLHSNSNNNMSNMPHSRTHNGRNQNRNQYHNNNPSNYNRNQQHHNSYNNHPHQRNNHRNRNPSHQRRNSRNSGQHPSRLDRSSTTSRAPLHATQRQQANRRRDIKRAHTTSHNIANIKTNTNRIIPTVNLIDTSNSNSPIDQFRGNNNNNPFNNNNNNNIRKQQQLQSKPTQIKNNNNNNPFNSFKVKSKEEELEGPMKQLSLDMIPYKYDYKSKLNMSLVCAKHNIDRFKFKMDPTKEHPWKYSTEQEKETHVRDYMLPCLQLLNNLQCMDEATDFIEAPNRVDTNPDHWRDYQRFENQGRNMCLEWVENLLKSDYYETVDEFANDMRHIWYVHQSVIHHKNKTICCF